MPGSGKSTIGKQLSDRLKMPFYDLDEIIEQKESMPISEIFKTKGEDFFRATESSLLESSISDLPVGVMSTGGGTPYFLSGMDKMLSSGRVVYLDVPLELLLDRTESNDSRPLLSANPEQKLKSLYKERRPVYKRAPYHITCGDDEVDSIVNKLLELIHQD